MKLILNISPETKLELEKVVGKCIAVLGITGSGKTNTTAVILEEMLKYKYPMTIVDIDGEYWGLKQKYELLVVGKSKNVDIEVNVEHARQIAEISISKNIPVILDMSGFLYEDTYEFLLNYIEEIWDLAGKYRKPYEIVLEEAHEFIPQGNKNDLKEILTRIALRGRKRGLGSIILSQRSAKVEKDILTQAEILFLHKVVHPSDLKVYKEILPLSNKDVHKLISSLNVGDCIFFFENNFELIHIRERETFHAGFTPSLKKVKSPKLKVVSNEILKSIQTLTKTKIKEKSDLDRLRTKVHKLEANISEKNVKIQKLERDLEILGRISVEVQQPNVTPQISESMVEQIIANMLNQSSNVENCPVDNIPDIKYEMLSYNVKEHINKILRRIDKLSKPKKEILKFLVNRSPQSYTYSSMSEWINYSESTLYKNHPTELIKMKIIDRKRKTDGFHYYSTIDTFVKKEFQVYFPEDSIYLKYILDYLKEQIQ
jgi:flagellar biosynthesis GTPase FlhF